MKINHRELVEEMVETSVHAHELEDTVGLISEPMINALGEMISHYKQNGMNRAAIRQKVVEDIRLFKQKADNQGEEKANRELSRYAADLHCMMYLENVSV